MGAAVFQPPELEFSQSLNNLRHQLGRARTSCKAKTGAAWGEAIKSGRRWTAGGSLDISICTQGRMWVFLQGRVLVFLPGKSSAPARRRGTQFRQGETSGGTGEPIRPFMPRQQSGSTANAPAR